MFSGSHDFSQTHRGDKVTCQTGQGYYMSHPHPAANTNTNKRLIEFDTHSGLSLLR
jgi:hypothetical protein